MYVVVGGTRGVGRKVAARFAEQRRPLLVAARTREALEETRESLLGEFSDAVVDIYPLDLADDASVTGFVSEIKNRNVLVRALVNTAAGFYKGPIAEQSTNDMNELLATNYIGVVKMLIGALREWRWERVCDIINITSISSATNLDTSRSSSLHIATKAALGLFGVVAGRELASEGKRITTLAPGTFARKGRIGVSEETIVDSIDWLIGLPSDAWIEQLVVRPTGIE